MTTIEAKFTGNKSDLELFSVCGIRFASKKQLNNFSLSAQWVCETDNKEQSLYECMDLINISEMEAFNIELDYIH